MPAVINSPWTAFAFTALNPSTHASNYFFRNAHFISYNL